jgi:hypothetical protein
MKKNFIPAITLIFFVTVIHAQRLPKAPCTTLLGDAMLRAVDTSKHPSRGMANNYAMWDNGKVILVKFMPGGSKSLRDRVMQSAKEWEQYANITFKFVPDNTAYTDIRILLGHGLGHNSAVGMESKFKPATEQTMNFDTVYFADARYYVARLKAKGVNPPYNWDQVIAEMANDPYHWDARELRRVVVHEFGHSLGLLHEQSYPSAVKWKKTDSVYNYYLETQGWDKDKVDFNVFEVGEQFYTNGTSYDPKSIMHYSIDSWQTENGYAVDENYDFSAGDKMLIAALYPKGQKESRLLVPKVEVLNFTRIDVQASSKTGLTIIPTFDLKTNSKLGQVYFVARLVNEDGFYVPTKNLLYYNWGGTVATYMKVNVLPNTNVSYNKKVKNLKLILPYSEIPDLKGKKVYVEFSVVLDDTKNNQYNKLMYYNSTDLLSIPNK